MAGPPQVQVNGLDALSSSTRNDEQNTPPTSRPALQTRKSSSLHKNMMAKLRPLPFQYVWAVWHDKSGSMNTTTSTTTSTTTTPNTDSDYDDRLTLLADNVSDIAAFYRIWNNFPWDAVKNKDSIHVFRQGVRPLWEDDANLDGGGLVLKIRREEGKAVRAWEEICLMGCGGELQSTIQEEHDHVLGMTYSPRLYWAHIIIWNKQGSNAKSRELLEQSVLARLSPELRPPSDKDYYYKKHSDHDGWKEATEKARAAKQ